MRIFLFLLCVSVFGFISSEYQKKTELFDKYLVENHKIGIPENKQSYFIFGADGCETCKKIDFDYIEKISKRNNLIIIIIYPKRAKIPESINKLLKNKNIFLDRGRFDRYDIASNTDAVITCESKKIINIKELDRWTPKDVDKLLTEIK